MAMRGDDIMSKFVIHPDADILAMLKAKGFSTYVIAKAKERTGEYILGQSTLTKLRKGGLPSWAELAKLVDLLHVSPTALIAFQTDDGHIYDLTGKRLDAPAPAPEPRPTMSYTYDPYYDDDPGLPPIIYTP